MFALSWPILGQMTGGSSREHHLDFKPVDISKTEAALREAETTCQLAIQQKTQEVEVSQELLRDAGAITERDMEELQPGKFLGNTIMDFYVKYLESRLPPEHRKLFYFFNSFFFTKILQSSAPTRINPCKVDYEQIRKWTEELNIFEKDYVFIPIVERKHWSLIILCNLSSVIRAPDEMMRCPCIVHLDPIKGKHESFDDLIKSYVLEAWMDKFQTSIDRDQLRHQLRALYQMKYIQAEVPQQDNSHDCGLYVLHYIEAFLMESTSLDFSFALSERGPHFAHSHFATEVLSKRRHIQNLILELSSIFQERARKCEAIEHLIQELMQTSQKLWAYLEDEGSFEGCIKDVLTTSPTIFNGQGCEINHASIVEDTIHAQYRQLSGISRWNNEPLILSGPQIGLVEYENRCESLSPKQGCAKLEVQVVGQTNFESFDFGTKHALIQEDAINIQPQHSSKISRFFCVPLDGLQFPHVEYERVNESFSSKHQHLELEEVLYVDLAKVQKEKKKNMTKEETSVLLSCKLEGGRFCKGNLGATHWNLISKEIEKKLGSLPSAIQCQCQYDTLLKAYKTYKKYCLKTNKTFSKVTKEERLDLKLATTLSEEWYTTIDEICSKASISPKHMKLSSNMCNDLHPLSLHDSSTSNPPPISLEKSFNDEAISLGSFQFLSWHSLFSDLYMVVLDSTYGAIEVALYNVFPTSVLSSLNDNLEGGGTYCILETMRGQK